MLLLSLIACGGDLLLTSGELGRINYTLETSYKMDGIQLSEAKLATGYPQRLAASLTIQGWKLVEDEPYMVYHSSPDEVTVESETLLDGIIGVPGFTIQADEPGSYLVESKKQDELVDQIHLDFVKPDEISVISWIRNPDAEDFSLEEGEEISVTVGSQAAFVPVPMHEGVRIVGDVEVDITVDPPEAAVVGYNIESVEEGGVNFNASPSSIYFIQEGTVNIGATDIFNDVTTYQTFTVTAD
jgi:hypothetical protein